jgi:hypothetical protein
MQEGGGIPVDIAGSLVRREEARRQDFGDLSHTP